MAKKKLVTSVLSQEQIDWVKETSVHAGVGAGAVLSELINQEMRNKTSRFRHDLSQAKLRIQLEKYNDMQMELEQKKAEITRKLKGERIAVPA